MTLTVVDAFADRPFSGNPAAVCVLDAPAEAAWMQAVAGEMNLSETAFVVPDGAGAFGLRWFTPTVEVDLCGHATLAAAHVLFETGALAPDDAARFDTRSGRLVVRTAGEAGYTMDFPATPPEPADTPPGTDAVFGESVWTGRSRFDLFLVLPSEAAVRALAPDPAAVAALGARGVIATALANADAPYDVVSRFFAPGAGVPEDPVTGSAHCAIGPYWAGHLGTSTLRCFQASRRGGHVGVCVAGDRVELTGRAVTVLRGALVGAAATG
ncbi:MAG TPA: PhzF family phenazine biosynthesis protein [Rubricoccaceae bacterium]|jgi:predicted PhzF superfamily epimerase YddE/YHI9